MKRIGSTPVYGCRALCKSQYAVSIPPPAHRGSSAPQTRARGEVDVFHKPRHGFATEPMNFGVGGCKITDCGVDREWFAQTHTLTVNKQNMMK